MDITKCLKALCSYQTYLLVIFLTRFAGHGKNEPDYRNVQTTVLNPKAVSMGELYGEFNLLTMEWKDGLLATAVREAVQVIPFYSF